MLRILLIGWVLGYLAWTLQRQETGMADLYARGRRAWTTDRSVVLGIVLLLMPLNWGLEALKWRLLAGPVARIGTAEALKGVLSGLSLGMVTPNTLGDYAARVWRLGGRPEAVGAVLLGRIAQLYVTLLVGNACLLPFVRVYLPQHRALFFGAGLTLALLLVAGGQVIANRGFVVRITNGGWRRIFARYFDVLARYRPAEVWQVVGLAALRYTVFSAQFGLLLWVFGVRLPLSALSTGIGLVYLGKSIVPAFHFLSDLGVRELSALYVFNWYGAAPAPVLAATLSLWLLNLLLPALVGSFWLLRRKSSVRPPSIRQCDAPTDGWRAHGKGYE